MTAWARLCAERPRRVRVRRSARRVLDAAWARAAGGRGPRQRGARPSTSADLGLIAPVASPSACAAGLAGLVVNPRDAALARCASPRRSASAPSASRAAVAAFVPLAVLGAFFWTTLTAHLARALLAARGPPRRSPASPSPPARSRSASSPARRRSRSRRRSARASPPPARGAPRASIPCHRRGRRSPSSRRSSRSASPPARSPATAASSASTASSSARSSTCARPASSLALALGGLFAPRGHRRGVRAALALVLGLAAARSSRRAPPPPSTPRPPSPQPSSAAPRSASPRSRILRKLTDRDHDGYSAYFGGGDCDDHDPHVNPGAPRDPGQRLDQDCRRLRPPARRRDERAARRGLRAGAAAGPPAASSAVIPADLNLVLVTIDTVRADLHYAGYPRELSPNLDELAARSVVFDRAYSLASYTGQERGAAHDRQVPERDAPELGALQQLHAGGHVRSPSASEGGRPHDQRPGAPLLRRAERDRPRLRRRRHVDAPGEGTIKGDGEQRHERQADRRRARSSSRTREHGRALLPLGALPRPARRLPAAPRVPSFGTSQRDLYDGEIAFVDKHLGRVLDAIAAAPWGKKTAIIVTSDHGEAFGEHKMWRHGSELWEELVHVPLIVHVPGRRARARRRRGAARSTSCPPSST